MAVIAAVVMMAVLVMAVLMMAVVMVIWLCFRAGISLQPQQV